MTLPRKNVGDTRKDRQIRMIASPKRRASYHFAIPPATTKSGRSAPASDQLAREKPLPEALGPTLLALGGVQSVLPFLVFGCPRLVYVLVGRVFNRHICPRQGCRAVGKLLKVSFFENF
jgi:hypothetical protein